MCTLHILDESLLERFLGNAKLDNLNFKIIDPRLKELDISCKDLKQEASRKLFEFLCALRAIVINESPNQFHAKVSSLLEELESSIQVQVIHILYDPDLIPGNSYAVTMRSKSLKRFVVEMDEDETDDYFWLQNAFSDPSILPNVQEITFRDMSFSGDLKTTILQFIRSSDGVTQLSLVKIVFEEESDLADIITLLCGATSLRHVFIDTESSSFPQTIPLGLLGDFARSNSCTERFVVRKQAVAFEGQDFESLRSAVAANTRLLEFSIGDIVERAALKDILERTTGLYAPQRNMEALALLKHGRLLAGVRPKRERYRLPSEIISVILFEGSVEPGLWNDQDLKSIRMALTKRDTLGKLFNFNSSFNASLLVSVCKTVNAK